MATTTNKIDMSQLPAPLFIEALDFDTLVAEITAEFQEREPNYNLDDENDPVVILIETCAYRELLLRQRVNDAAKSVTVAYAQDADLEQLGANLRVAKFTGESNDDFRARIVIASDAYSVAGPEAAYVSIAKDAHADVADVTATSPEPCDVVVTVLAKDGDGTPSPEVLAAVTAAVTAKTARPLGDRVEVNPATVIEYEIDIQVWTYAGPDSSVVLAESAKRVEAYRVAQRRLGRDITVSGLTAAAFADGAQRVVVVSPPADVVCEPTEAGHCTATTITPMGTAE